MSTNGLLETEKSKSSEIHNEEEGEGSKTGNTPSDSSAPIEAQPPPKHALIGGRKNETMFPMLLFIKVGVRH